MYIYIYIYIPMRMRARPYRRFMREQKRINNKITSDKFKEKPSEF